MAWPLQTGAQSSNKAAASKATTATEAGEPGKAAKKPSAGPFHGKLAAMDKTAKTIQVGKRTFLVTSDTRIQRAGNPATLDQAVVGEQVSGYVKPDQEGKLRVTTLNLGPKAPQKTGEKDKQAR